MIWLFTPQNVKNKPVIACLFLLLLTLGCTNPEFEEVERRYDNGNPELVVLYHNSEGKKVKIKETHYFEDRSVKMTGLIVRNKRDGLWKAYFNNGKVQSTCYYSNGLKHGPILVWDTKGNLMYQGEYSQDKKIGKWLFYSSDGKIVKTEIFKLPTE